MLAASRIVLVRGRNRGALAAQWGGVQRALHAYIRRPISRVPTNEWRSFSSSGFGRNYRDETLYETLGVSPGATAAEIRRAYIKMSKKYHPDASGNSNTHEQFSRISSAYKILSDETKRREYDNLLASQRPIDHETILNQDGAGGGMPVVEYPEVDVDKSCFVTRPSGHIIPMPPWLALLLARGGWPQSAQARRQYRPYTYPLFAVLLVLLLLFQVRSTYRHLRGLDPSIVPAWLLPPRAAKKKKKKKGEEEKGEEAKKDKPSPLPIDGAGGYFEMISAYREAIINSADDAKRAQLEARLIRFYVESRKKELIKAGASPDSFGVAAMYIQPYELEDDTRRLRFSGGLLGASAVLASRTYQMKLNPTAARGTVGFLFWMAFPLWTSSLFTPLISSLVLPYPSSTLWDWLHGNIQILCRDIGMGYGLALVYRSRGLALTSSGAFLASALVGRWMGYMSSKFITGRYFSAMQPPPPRRPSEAQ